MWSPRSGAIPGYYHFVQGSRGRERSKTIPKSLEMDQHLTFERNQNIGQKTRTSNMRTISGLVTAGCLKDMAAPRGRIFCRVRSCGTGCHMLKQHARCTVLGMAMKYHEIFLFHVNQKQFPNLWDFRCLTVFPTTPRDLCDTKDHDLCLLGSAKGVPHNLGLGPGG